jgi:hypothetical protein
VGVDHPECRLLAAQQGNDPREHRMFDHIGKIPGMECVAIVHAASPAEGGRTDQISDIKATRVPHICEMQQIYKDRPFANSSGSKPILKKSDCHRISDRAGRQSRSYAPRDATTTDFQG